MRGRIAGIRGIGAVGDVDDGRTDFPEARQQTLDVGYQQAFYAVEAVLGALGLAPFGEQLAQPHIPVARGVLHVDNDQGRLSGVDGERLAEGIDKSRLAHVGCSLELSVHPTSYWQASPHWHVSRGGKRLWINLNKPAMAREA